MYIASRGRRDHCYAVILFFSKDSMWVNSYTRNIVDNNNYADANAVELPRQHWLNIRMYYTVETSPGSE